MKVSVSRMLTDVKGRKILVTGGSGFIGSHMVNALTERGAHAVIVDDLSTGREQNIDPSATFYKINIADQGIERILEREKPEVIYHLAFFVLVPKSVDNPLLDVDSIIGSIRLLQKAREIGVKKIVMASSGFLYGNTPHLPAKEEYPIDPVSPYVVSKYAIENYLRFFYKAYRIPYTILRYASVFGPRQVTGAMADYIRKLSSGCQAEIWGDGNKTRDYVYIKDVVEANLLALAVPLDHPNPVFNIGTGIETTLNALYREIADLLGVQANPTYHPDRPGEQLRYCLDCTKAKRELGWEPKHSLADGLRITVQAYNGSG